jgi:hypothetical protein
VTPLTVTLEMRMVYLPSLSYEEPALTVTVNTPDPVMERKY